MSGPGSSGHVSLSVCCLAGDPPARVAALLRLVRDVADEIVVAVDSRVAVEEAGAYEGVADRLLRVEFEPPLERYLAWLHALCRGDWILRLDGDEVPSPALVEALPELVSATDVVQYCTPRRWLFPDEDRWLGEPPWVPDYQIRLVRNDPAVLRFPGLIHTSAEPVLPRRYLEQPIYHLVLMLTPASEREARITRYDALRTRAAPDVDNAAFYLPERRQRLVSMPVPEADREFIRDVLGADGGQRPMVQKPALELAVVSREEVERAWSARPLAAGAYRARITPLDRHLELELGQTRTVPVRVENLGTEPFPWGEGEPAIRLTYKWFRPGGEVVVSDGPRTLLPAGIRPGRSGVVPLQVVAPPQRGRHVLSVDLVHEGVRWFECPGYVYVDVRATPVSVSGAER
jgi:hypothetical protein